MDMIEKFTVCRNDDIYEAWPDVALTHNGNLICVFSECTHHGDRSYTRIMMTKSSDRGRTWSPKKPITEGTKGLDYYYNCARITQLKDGRLVMLVDRIYSVSEGKAGENEQRNYLYFSSDEGETWSEPLETPARGIVPDQLIELDNGRWFVACHYRPVDFNFLTQRVWYTDDQGESWQGPFIIGKVEGLNLCEVSILPLDDSLVAFMRENSGQGWDCYKSISRDGGETWSEPARFPLPGCHRPVAGLTMEGDVMITYRFMQGGKGWLGSWTQNFFSALTDKESCLTDNRQEAWARILPVDYDRSTKSDLGYSGWVQFDDGEIYIVNYIKDDAPKCYIRGYSLCRDDFAFFDMECE